MILRKLIDNMMSIKGVRTYFKQMDKGLVIIFWNGPSPIAHVFVEAYEYSLEYPMLYEMNLHDILSIDAWLYAFVNTDIIDRQLG